MRDTMDESFLIYASAILGGTEHGLSGIKIKELLSSYAVKYNVDLSHSSKSQIKHVMLFKYLKCFDEKQRANIINDLSKLPKFKDNEKITELRLYLISKAGDLIDEKLVDTELITETKHWLQNYPDALKQYENALLKYNTGIFERNTLDDMRLALELLLKSILGNNNSLEHQTSELGQKLQRDNISKELRNTVLKIMDHYCKYQNDYVKHNDKVKSSEVDWVIGITSFIMKLLIKS